MMKDTYTKDLSDYFSRFNCVNSKIQYKVSWESQRLIFMFFFSFAPRVSYVSPRRKYADLTNISKGTKAHSYMYEEKKTDLSYMYENFTGLVNV